MLAGILMQNLEAERVAGTLATEVEEITAPAQTAPSPNNLTIEERKTALAFEERSTSKAAESSVRQHPGKGAGHRQQIRLRRCSGQALQCASQDL